MMTFILKISQMQTNLWWNTANEVLSGVFIFFWCMVIYNKLRDLKQFTISQSPWGEISWIICSGRNQGCNLFRGSGSSFNFFGCWQNSVPCSCRIKALNSTGMCYSLQHVSLVLQGQQENLSVFSNLCDVFLWPLEPF